MILQRYDEVSSNAKIISALQFLARKIPVV